MATQFHSTASRIIPAPKVYEAFDLGSSQMAGDVHVEPLVREYISVFLAVTNIDWAALGSMSFKDALHAANQTTVMPDEMVARTDLSTLLESFSREGRDVLSRNEMKAIIGSLAASALAEANCGQREVACVTVAQLKDYLIEHIENTSWPANRKDKWINWLQEPLEEFRRQALSKVYLEALIGRDFRDICNKYARRYIECVHALLLHRETVDFDGYKAGREEIIKFLLNVEQHVPRLVESCPVDSFREEVLEARCMHMEEHDGAEPDYDVHEVFGQCIEAYARAQVKDVARMVCRSEKQETRLQLLQEVLIEGHRYCKHCARELVTDMSRGTFSTVL